MDARNYMIRRHMRRVQVLRYWVPALLWSALLLLASGKQGRGTLTEALLQWALTGTVGNISPEMFKLLHFLFRKTLHVTAYGIAASLNFRAVRAGRAGWTPKWSIIAIALAAIVGALDEWHQTLVPGRTGTIDDVALDTAGAALAQLIWRFSASRRTSTPDR
jgi:VanZ family protein